jgi:hypothetical protein
VPGSDFQKNLFSTRSPAHPQGERGFFLFQTFNNQSFTGLCILPGFTETEQRSQPESTTYLNP